jgi:hypothetical protein
LRYLLHTKLGQYRGQLTGPRRPLTREPLDPRNSQRRPSDRRRFGPRMLTCESSRTRHPSASPPAPPRAGRRPLLFHSSCSTHGACHPPSSAYHATYQPHQPGAFSLDVKVRASC